MAQRIHITGNAGSGKTTLALELGNLLDLPVYHLDTIVWQPGWQKTSLARRKVEEDKLVQRERWIIDGVSARVRNAADLVIFLDVPRTRCLLQAFRRNWRYLFRSRPGLPANCPEWRILPRLIGIILRFPERIGSSIATEGQSAAHYKRIQSANDLNVLTRWLVSESDGHVQ